MAVLGPPLPPLNSQIVSFLTVLRMTDGRLTEDAALVDSLGYLSVEATRSDGVGVFPVGGRPWFGWAWPGDSDESPSPPPANALATAFGGSPWTPLLMPVVLSGQTDALETAIRGECFAEFATLRTSQTAARFPTRLVGGVPVSVSLLPYRGDVLGGFGDLVGGAGVIVAGSLLRIASDGSLEVRESAALPGMVPIGLIGPNGSWMALADVPQFSVANRNVTVDHYQVGETARVSLAPLEQVLSPEAEDGTLHPRLVGAVPDPARAPDELLTGPAGFRAEVEVPPGSRLFVAPLGEGFRIDPSWVGRADDGHAVVPVAVFPGRDTFNVRAFVVTPAGHGYTIAWHVTVLSEPPPIEASAEWAPFGFDVPLHGSTDAQATVLVNGAAVAVAADGSFAASVLAPPWPTRVVVEAIDRVGNRTTTTMSVVGLLDYRQLPWVPIIVGLTVVAAVALFLFAPRLRPPTGTAHPDDGTLEEIEDR